MTPERIIVHHSDTIDDGDTLSWGPIRRYHIEVNGWRDIGYHCGIEKVGGSYETLIGRPWDVVGAHCLGHNINSLGLCFVGDWDAETPENERLIIGAKLIKFWLRLFNIPATEIWPHSKFYDTLCPGRKFPLDKLIEYAKSEG